MIDQVRKGHLYNLSYGGAKKIPNLEFIFVLRRTDENTLLCVPVLTCKTKCSITTHVDGTCYYIDCANFLKLKDNQLVPSKVILTNSAETIDLIYRKNKAHQSFNRKKRIKKKKLSRELRMIEECRNMGTKKKSAPYTVGWSMAHPVQGGRTNPR